MEEERSLWVGKAWKGTVGLQEEAEPVCGGMGMSRPGMEIKGMGKTNGA